MSNPMMMNNAMTMDELEALGSRAQGRRLGRIGLTIFLLALVPMAAWVCTAPLSMAVVAPAYVKVDLNRRPIQHLEGGIVRQVLVRDGQRVRAGEPVLMLGDVGVDVDRNRLAYRAIVERASLARLEGEQLRTASLRFPDDLRDAAERDPRVAQAMAKEASLFASRRTSLESEVALMRTQRQQVGSEAQSLRAQITNIERSLTLQRQDLELNRGLQRDSFISSAKLSQIEATVADYAAKVDERRSELARAAQRIADIDLRIRSLQNAYVQTASDEVKGSVARLTDIDQEMRKTDDAASRQVVVAPASGEIIDLKFTSPGAVVRPGDSIAEIVPSDARLMLEAHIRPEEINHVYQGQKARIKFTALKYRSAPMVEGEVTYISADRLVDKGTGQSYFSVLVAADEKAIGARHAVKLQAGMSAEVYIDGATQTPLQYLVEPVMSTFRKAGRQL
ncbi:HlyD family type I secretion periplasmic adaptor subunit [Massilia sp. CMS3.1]|uniref:HlyD family type I secretion periplasmic adaptor subunit n=1 Tax=Massilia sp. CMS3.1 TaxID=3373083 RepID=UPI003EE458F9